MSIVKGGDTSLLDLNKSHTMSSNSATGAVFREFWDTDHPNCETISLHQAIETIRSRASYELSDGLVKALEKQMDINQDGAIDFNEFARACAKIFDV